LAHRIGRAQAKVWQKQRSILIKGLASLRLTAAAIRPCRDCRILVPSERLSGDAILAEPEMRAGRQAFIVAMALADRITPRRGAYLGAGLANGDISHQHRPRHGAVGTLYPDPDRARLPCPDLQAAILEGCRPATLSVAQIVRNDLPMGWTEQQPLFGAD